MPVLRPSRSVPRKVAKIFAWMAAVVLILLAALALFVATFNWNHVRPWVDDKVSQALARPFVINGDLRVGWQRPVDETGWRAWVPWARFSADQVMIGNPEWARRPEFANVDAISFAVKVLPLIARTISVPSIHLVNPSIDLERMADGRNNWTFLFHRAQEPSRWTLELGNLGFEKGNLTLSDALAKLDLQVDVDTLGEPIAIGDVLKQQGASSRHNAPHVVSKREEQEKHAASGEGGAPQASAPEWAAERASGAAGSTGDDAATTSPEASPETSPGAGVYALGLTAKGRYRETAVAGSGKIGSVLALRDPARPFPLQADIEIGDTRLALVGTLTDPLHLAALDLRLWLQGASASHLYPILGIPLPDTPPYATDGRLAGHIRPDDISLTYSGFTGHMGDSDLSGRIRFERRSERSLLKGEVVSHLLRFEDLASIVGAHTNARKAQRGNKVKQPAGRALPVEPFRSERWRAIDVDLKFTGRRIVNNPQLPVNDVYTHVVLKDGVLTLEPLRFGVAGGTLNSNITLDGSAVPPTARISMSARHLKLRQLFPSQKTMQSALGELNGDAALSATGNSPAALAATLNGEAKALVTEGKLSQLLMEAAGLNVANVVYERLFGAHDINIRCAAADFVANDGVLDARTFALDTDDALIDMSGRIDLRNESMDLAIHPHTKGLRVFSLRSPLYVKGTFKDPDVGVSRGALALRAGAAVALGFVNPFAALIPLIVPSRDQPVPCSALIAQLREAPRAPAPGAAKTGEPTPSTSSAPARPARPVQTNGSESPGQGG